MKAGTATKMVLNIITTAAMVRWGKVYDNLMVDLVAANEKLRHRSMRLVEQVAGVDSGRALELLREAEGSVKLAIVMGRRGLDPDDARALLAAHNGHLRPALEE
jgi:N-acetylmuramic acid 6-phosphate etherase